MGKGIQKISFSVGEPGLTHFAGMVLIHQFCKFLQLKRFFQYQVRLSHRNTYYHSSQLLLAHFYFTLAGLGRLTNTQLLKHNGLIPPIIGFHQFPSANAMRNFLKGLTPRDIFLIMRAHDIIRGYMFIYPQPLTSIVVDLDSSVLTVYGQHEEATVGYNPHKRGRRSYNPLFAFESHLKASLLGKLRPGNLTDRSEGVLPFLTEVLEKLPSTIATSRIRVRADSGFCSWRIVHFLDEEGYGYAIVARMTKPIKNMLPGLRYHIFNHEEHLAAAEFSYQPHTWKEPHRFIAIRRRLPPEGQGPDRQLLVIDRYDYDVLVTNLGLNPESVWYFYRGRADIENRIKELKYDFSLSQIPTRVFLANQGHMQLLLMDYDLFRWFQLLCLPESYQNKTLDTIRDKLLMLPAKLVSSGHKHTLKLPKGLTDIQLFNYVFQKTKRVKSLI